LGAVYDQSKGGSAPTKGKKKKVDKRKVKGKNELEATEKGPECGGGGCEAVIL